MDPREAYAALLSRLDAFFARVRAEAGTSMRCAPGCADCCARSLSLFPVEVQRLVEAARALPPGLRAGVRARAALALREPEAACPLLVDGRCAVYPARPVICRTHGLPLLVPGPTGPPELSVCPLNFHDVARFSGLGVLDLGPVNAVLATVNRLLADETGASPERVGVAEALCAALEEEE
ncbi:MAG TPA: YkgJ family cysteine cluster protein [Myxococcota bacterium]|nr:YkgJ family cysteine cluster protein [Myxococcota bacterium]HRY91932.1 YkgJ family cysteine cluster protein [Myxococcota bacterium]HSA22283.1 YkgJ family cysteine cluster protein [Myxococcota bacterium]